MLDAAEEITSEKSVVKQIYETQNDTQQNDYLHEFAIGKEADKMEQKLPDKIKTSSIMENGSQIFAASMFDQGDDSDLLQPIVVPIGEISDSKNFSVPVEMGQKNSTANAEKLGTSDNEKIGRSAHNETSIKQFEHQQTATTDGTQNRSQSQNEKNENFSDKNSLSVSIEEITDRTTSQFSKYIELYNEKIWAPLCKCGHN